MAEGASKRRREFTFQQHKCNEFLDYMMQASDEDKAWWAKFFWDGGSSWEWLKYGEYLELHTWNQHTIGFTRNVGVIGDLTNGPERGAWLKRCDEELYQKSPRDIWISVFRQLTTVQDIVACSSVCKKFHAVCRMDILYEKWISVYKTKLKDCPNPFANMPLWKQFYCLSGQYSGRWYEWFVKKPACVFLYDMLIYGQSLTFPIFDLEARTIRQGKQIWLEYTEYGFVHIETNMPLQCSPHRLKLVAQQILEREEGLR